jgi:hypothetical protein
MGQINPPFWSLVVDSSETEVGGSIPGGGILSYLHFSVVYRISALGIKFKSYLKQRQPLWSNGHSSWLQIQRSGFDSLRYQIFWEVVGLERGPLSFVSTIEELLQRKSSSSSLECREYGRRDPSRWTRGTLYPQKLALTSPTSGVRSVGIVCSQTEATVFFTWNKIL